MSGHISGVAARLQECESQALYVHCLAHCTNLCLQTVARQVEPVRNALNLAMELCQLICFSPQRSSLFEALKSQVSTPTPSLKPLCPTRWTVRTKAIDALLKNYSLLMETLSEMKCSGRDDSALKAGGFLNTMETFTAFFGLRLSYLVFSVTEQLSITLQGKNTTIQEAVSSGNLTTRFLQSHRNKESFNVFYERVLQDSAHRTSEPTLPRQRRPPRRLDGASTHKFEDVKAYFRQLYYQALDVASEELKRRCDQNRGMHSAASVEKTLLDACNHCQSDITIPEELGIYANELDLQIQLHMLPDLVRAYNEQTKQGNKSQNAL